jgi:hypothetical protein
VRQAHKSALAGSEHDDEFLTETTTHKQYCVASLSSSVTFPRCFVPPKRRPILTTSRILIAVAFNSQNSYRSLPVRPCPKTSSR